MEKGKSIVIAIFFCLIFCLFLINIVKAAIGEKSIAIQVEGCGDGTKCSECSSTQPLFCDCSIGRSPENGSKLIDNYCRGPDLEIGTADDCGCPLPSYCSPKDGSCTSETGNCEKYGGSSPTECIKYGAGCYFNNSKCKTCEPAGDKNCNNYDNKEACESDICGYGKHGIGSAMCLTAEYCECLWDTTTSTCGLNATTEEGVSCTYKSTHLSECVDGKASWTWTKVCNGDTTTGSEEVDCGKAISPLPFFTTSSFLFVVVLLFIYYAFLMRRKNFVK